jgi:hypothetical protein
MPASYSKFTFDDLSALKITVEEGQVFPKPILPVEASDFLLKELERNRRRKLRSEKAKSEFLISPILGEIEERNPTVFAFYSGYNFTVDKEKGLKGFCDYIFSLNPKSLVIEAPVFSVVEAKNDNLDDGVPQCVAELYAASIFNARKGTDIPVLYGATTFGFEWKFIRFENMTAIVDTKIYFLNQLPELLGVLQHIIDVQKIK